MENDNFNLQIFLYNFSIIILLSLWLVYITNDTKDKDFFDFLKNNYINIHNFIDKKIFLLNQYQNFLWVHTKRDLDHGIKLYLHSMTILKIQIYLI